MKNNRPDDGLNIQSMIDKIREEKDISVSGLYYGLNSRENILKNIESNWLLQETGPFIVRFSGVA